MGGKGKRGRGACFLGVEITLLSFFRFGPGCSSRPLGHQGPHRGARLSDATGGPDRGNPAPGCIVQTDFLSRGDRGSLRVCDAGGG